MTDLHNINVDPKHQKRGAGVLLVKWGLNEAQKLGLPAHLNGSPAGHKLYLQCGFRDLERADHDFGEWGVTGSLSTWAMMWEPEVLTH